jgi:hypothetical protein
MHHRTRNIYDGEQTHLGSRLQPPCAIFVNLRNVFIRKHRVIITVTLNPWHKRPEEAGVRLKNPRMNVKFTVEHSETCIRLFTQALEDNDLFLWDECHGFAAL